MSGTTISSLSVRLKARLSKSTQKSRLQTTDSKSSSSSDHPEESSAPPATNVTPKTSLSLLCQLPEQAETPPLKSGGEDLADKSDFWSKAYNDLCARDAALITSYEQWVSAAVFKHGTSSEQIRSTQSKLSGVRRQELLLAYVECQANLDEKSAWAVQLGDKRVVLRKQIKKALKIISFAKDFVSKAVQMDPHASLAWTGVCLLLPLLMNSQDQHQTLLDGLEVISDIIHRYTIVTRVYCNMNQQGIFTTVFGGNEPTEEMFQAPLVKLYSRILEYQARCACKLSSSKALQVWRDTFKMDSIDTLLVQIKESDSECQRYLDLQNSALSQHESRRQELRHAALVKSVESNVLKQMDSHRAEQETQVKNILRGELRYESGKNFPVLRETGTCQWVLCSSKFIDWKEGKGSGLLWIQAGPGYGKSVLARSLIDEKLLGHLTPTVCYYFFKHNNHRDACDAVSALLHQLFVQRPALTEHALRYLEDGNLLPHDLSTLWELFLNVASSPDLPALVCVLDSLDVSSDRGDAIIERLSEFYSRIDFCNGDQQMGNQKLKFLVTSRSSPEIQIGLGELVRANPNMKLSADDDDENRIIEREIRIVINSRVEKIAKDFNLNTEAAALLRGYLLGKKNRTYLWVDVILKIVKKSKADGLTTRTRMRAFIGKLPDSSDVNDAYETLLATCTNPGEVLRLLHIVVAATPPLTVSEMRIALSITEETKSIDDLDLEQMGNFKDRIRAQSGEFVTITGGSVEIIHETAKDFLLQKSESTPFIQPTDINKCWKHSLYISESHEILALTCIRYLCFQDFIRSNNRSYKSPGAIKNCQEGSDARLVGYGETDECYSDDSMTVYHPGRWKTLPVNRRFREHHFLKYASTHWLKHYQKARHSEDLLGESLKLCCVRSDICRNWFETLPEKEHRDLLFFEKSVLGLRVERSEDLIFCSYIGHANGVEQLLDFIRQKEKPKNIEVIRQKEKPKNIKDIREKEKSKNIEDIILFALYIAVQEGHDEVVRKLLGTADTKHMVNAQLLYTPSAFMTNPFATNMTALRLAIRSGQLHLAPRLLEMGANPNPFGPPLLADVLVSPCSSAVISETVELLASRGAKVQGLGRHESEAVRQILAGMQHNHFLRKESSEHWDSYPGPVTDSIGTWISPFGLSLLGPDLKQNDGLESGEFKAL